MNFALGRAGGGASYELRASYTSYLRLGGAVWASGTGASVKLALGGARKKQT